jgi:hypothetical protein
MGNESGVRSQGMKETGKTASSASGLFMKIVICLFALVTCDSLPVTCVSHAAISDRVIAFVDDHAITLSELTEQYQNTIKVSPGITIGEVLNTMINKVLIVREARKYRIEAPSVEQIMREYIDLKIRAYIRVGEADIEQFYRDNKANFPGRDYEDVREEIEKYLSERELNERLKEVLRELRTRAYIRIYLDKDR